MCPNNDDNQCLDKWCSGTTCSALLVSNSCTRNTQCQTGYCHRSTNQCTALPTTGQTCGLGASNTDICGATDFCLTSDNSKTCTARASLPHSGCHATDKKCASGLFCHTTKNYCENKVAANGACTLGTHSSFEERINMCASSSSYCTATSHQTAVSSAPGTCAANNRKSVGTACTHDAECMETASCNTSGACAARVLTGQECGKDAMCPHNSYCRVETPRVCAYRGSLRQGCNEENASTAAWSPCEYGLDCSASPAGHGQCQRQSTNAVCSRDDECGLGLYCGNRSCRAKIAGGQFCYSHESCVAGHRCVDNACRPIANMLTGGHSYNDAELCESGIQ